jgi:cytochrome P450
MGDAVFNPLIGVWMVSSYQNVRRVLANDAFAEDKDQLVELFGGATIEALDEPEHKEVRDIWNPHLLRDAVGGWQQLIEEITDELLDATLERLTAGETVDVVPVFLKVLPSLVVARLLGLPRSDHALFSRWCKGIGGALDVRGHDTSDHAEGLRVRAREATDELAEYIGEQLEQRRREDVKDDLIGMMAHATVDMTEAERRANIVQLVFAGQDTTSKWMGHTLVSLAQHPDQRRAVELDRTLIPQALEEVMRWQSPIANTRFARGEDFLLGEQVIPAGARCLAVQTAACRDPARWEDPDAFDIFREKKQHAGFGFGIHSCLGINLARLEARVWLDRVLDRLPRYELAVEEIDYGPNYVVRGPVAVPIALD